MDGRFGNGGVPGEEGCRRAVPLSFGRGNRTNGLRGIGAEPEVDRAGLCTPLVEQLARLAHVPDIREQRNDHRVLVAVALVRRRCEERRVHGSGARGIAGHAELGRDETWILLSEQHLPFLDGTPLPDADAASIQIHHALLRHAKRLG